VAQTNSLPVQDGEKGIHCIEVSLDEVRSMPRIASGFATEFVYRLERRKNGSRTFWTLREARLSHPFRKVYDNGDPEEWLASYAESVRADALRFVAARVDGQIRGLASWYQLSWNNSIWLIDIRSDQSARRRGVGTTLMRHVQDVARATRVRGISVESQINNYPALRFYEKNGFEVVGFNDHLYTNRDYEDQDVAVFLFWETQ